MFDAGDDIERLFFVCNLSGIVPFKWKNGSLAKFTLCCLPVALTALPIHFIFIHSYISNGNAFGDTMGLLIILAMDFSVIISLLSFLHEKQNLESSLNYFILTYKRLLSYAFILSRKIIIIFGIIWIVILLGLILISIQQPNLLEGLILIYYLYFTTYKAGLLLLFSVLVQMPGDCLSTMNTVMMDAEIANVHELFATYVQIYNKLINNCLLLNSCFRTQLFFIIAIDVSNILYESYTYITASYELKFAMLALINASVSVIEMVAVFICCESVTQKADNFSDILSNLALQEYKGQHRENPLITMHFIVGKKLRFTTYGGLVLDYRLLLSLTASCITYLTILLQFSNQPQPVIATNSSMSTA